MGHYWPSRTKRTGSVRNVHSSMTLINHSGGNSDYVNTRLTIRFALTASAAFETHYLIDEFDCFWESMMV